MSAFIVDDETINRIVDFVNQMEPWDLGNVGLEPFDHDVEIMTAFGKRLYAMNCDAVRQRYEHHDDATFLEMFGPIGYQWATVTTDTMAAYKSLSCLIYQCTEGDVDESQDYAMLIKLRGMWADAIVCDLPAYDAAAGW